MAQRVTQKGSAKAVDPVMKADSLKKQNKQNKTKQKTSRCWLHEIDLKWGVKKCKSKKAYSGKWK